MTVAAQSPVRLNFVGRGDQGLYAEAAAAIDVFRPSLTINVKTVVSGTDSSWRSCHV